MLVLLSPTKQMNFTSDYSYKLEFTEPQFMTEAGELNNLLRALNSGELINLMKISEKLADETHKMIIRYGCESIEKGAALHSYSGTVFQQLDAKSFNETQWSYAADHFRILSGLYGYLRPADKISPYRLEMKTPLKNPRGSGLYHFWKQKITESVLSENRPVLNLASAEYSKAIDRKKLNQPMVSVAFREKSGDRYRTVGMYSKMARGRMAGEIVRNQLEIMNEILEWDINGYRFDESLSSDEDWIFTGNWRM